jgi:hypothetical protein
MNYHYSLSLDVPLFKTEVNPFEFPKVRHTKISSEYLNPKIVEIFSSLNLDIVLIEVFYSQPRFISGIHIDGDGGDINKINWVFGGRNCAMNWYSVKSDKLVNQSYETNNKTIINTTYRGFLSNEVVLENTAILESPSIVNVGVPHNVHNCLEQRWCVSLVYKFKDSKKRPTMQESLEIFKNFISL